MRFDIRGFRTNQPLCHPVVNQRVDGMGGVVGFTATNQSIVGVNPDQDQVGHDVGRDGRFDGYNLGHDGQLSIRGSVAWIRPRI